MMKQIDLHVHTTASDGTFTPSEAVCHAAELGLSAIAITDHDTHEGIAEAVLSGAEHGVEVIPGIEISLDFFGRGIHILGYFIDPEAPSLCSLLNWVMEERERRNALIARAMQDDGIPVTIEQLKAENPGAVIGRPHFASALVSLGLAATVKDAFNRYLSIGQKYFRKREYIPLQQAFDVIHSAGGKAVFAHPLQYHFDEPYLISLTRTLTDAGAVGMECLYYTYNEEEFAYLQELAAAFGLCVTGGSDFHGIKKLNEMGKPAVPYSLLEQLKAR